MRLAYRGAEFHGWQSQPNDISVQETIEKAMTMIMREPVKITGAGRTDAGVNAATMIAHFDASPIADAAQLVHQLNSVLPRDIAIYSIFAVHDDAHARFDAVSRTYKYFAHTSKNPFAYPLSWQCPPTLDFELMNEAAQHLLRYTDFTSFSKLHTDVKTNNCRVTRAEWACRGDGLYVFTITADRFLRNMVRAIVGTLFVVGRGKMTPEQFCEIIEAKDRCKAGTSAPAEGLYLVDVKYDYL